MLEEKDHICCKEGHDDFALIFLFIDSTISVISVIINLFIIYAVIRYKYLRCASNKLATFLALSDLSTALLIPYYISFYFDVDYKCYKFACLSRHMLILFTTLWSLLIMIGIAFDRYIAFVKPLHYSTIINGKRVTIYIFTTAIYMGTLCLLPFLDVINIYDPENITECDLYYVVSASYAIPIVCGHVALAIISTSILYWRVFKSAHKCKNLTPELESNIACTMFLLFAVRIFVYFPYFIAVLLRYILPKIDDESLDLANKIATVLIFAKTITSPLICIGRTAGFRVALKKLFQFNRRDSCQQTSADDTHIVN